MVDITQPSILGYAVTPWLIVLCASVIGTILFTILVVSGFTKKDAKEREMIENAVKNTASIPVGDIEIKTMDFSDDGAGGTESFLDSKTEGMGVETEGFESRTEGFDSKTEGFDTKTEGFDFVTEGFGAKTEFTEGKTEGLAFDSDTEAFSQDGTEAFTEGKTEGLDFQGSKTSALVGGTSKFCSYCGNEVEGKFCSHCGNEVN